MNYEHALVQLGFSINNIRTYLPNTADQKTLFDNYQALKAIGFSDKQFSDLFRQKPRHVENFVHGITLFLLNHRSLQNDFKIVKVSDYIELMKLDSFVTAIPVLMTHQRELVSLGITKPEQLIAICKPYDSIAIIKKLVSSAPKLAKLGIVDPQHLVSIASHDYAKKTIESLINYGSELIKKLKIEKNIESLITIASQNNAGGVIKALMEHVDILHTKLKITEIQDIVKICVQHGASETIKALADYGPKLKNDMQFTTQHLVRITTELYSGAALTIHFIAENIERLKQNSVSVDQILTLPKFFGNKSTHKSRLNQLLSLINLNGLSSTSVSTKRKPSDEVESTLSSVPVATSTVAIKQEAANSLANLNMLTDTEIEPEVDDFSLPLSNCRHTQYSEASTSTKLSSTTIDNGISSARPYKRRKKTTLPSAQQNATSRAESIDDDNNAMSSDFEVETSAAGLEKALQDCGFALHHIRSHLNTTPLKQKMLDHYESLHKIGFRQEHYLLFLKNVANENTICFINTIPVFLLHHTDLKNLNITEIEDYTKIMVQSGASVAIPTLIRNKEALAEIGITAPEDLVAITKPGGASLTITALANKETIEVLKKIGISSPKQLVKIASFDSANNTFTALIEKGAELIEIMEIHNIEDLVTIAAHSGGGPAIVALAQNLDILRNKLNITKVRDLVNISNINGASKTIIALGQHGENLMKELGFTTQQLVSMAIVRNSAAQTLEFLGDNIQNFKRNSVGPTQILGVYQFNENCIRGYASKTAHADRVRQLTRLITQHQHGADHAEDPELTPNFVGIKQEAQDSASTSSSWAQTKSRAVFNNKATLFGKSLNSSSGDIALQARKPIGRPRNKTAQSSATTIVHFKQEVLENAFATYVYMDHLREDSHQTATNSQLSEASTSTMLTSIKQENPGPRESRIIPRQHVQAVPNDSLLQQGSLDASTSPLLTSNLVDDDNNMGIDDETQFTISVVSTGEFFKDSIVRSRKKDEEYEDCFVFEKI